MARPFLQSEFNHNVNYGSGLSGYEIYPSVQKKMLTNSIVCLTTFPVGNTDQASCPNLWRHRLCVFVSDHNKKSWLMSALIPQHIDGLINYMFSWTPAVTSKRSQTNFLLRCSKALANLHIYLMLFKKISRFLIYYLVSFSCLTRRRSISTRMMIRSPAKNTYH